MKMGYRAWLASSMGAGIVALCFAGSVLAADTAGFSAGPGQRETEAGVVMEQQPAVNASVKEVKLEESYHEDYLIYEESLENIYFIYSNTGNGSITNKSVYLDIPAGLTYTAEMNGQPMEYISRTHLEAEGTYVFRFRAANDASLPLSQQTEYRTTFRFRIQTKPPEAVSKESKASETREGKWFDPEGNLIDGPLTGETEEAGKETGESTEAAGEEEITEPETAEEAETKSSEEENPQKETKETQLLTGNMQETYQPLSATYKEVLPDGSEIISNVPNGAVTDSTVLLELPSAGVETLVYKDGAEYTAEDMTFTEEGFYRIVFPQSISAGGGDQTSADPVMNFRIIINPTNKMDIITPPVGMVIVSVSRNSEEQQVNPSYYEVVEDGSYDVTMMGEARQLHNFHFIKKTIAPAYVVNNAKTGVTVDFLTGDAASVTLHRNGKEAEFPAGGVIKENGNYDIYVSDVAGNVSHQQFIFKKRLNGTAVVLIVLVAGIITAGGIFAYRVKESYSVQ